MDKKTKGAWIVHHTNKLKTVTTHDFDQINLAGKCGMFLSNLVSSEQTNFTNEQVGIIAQAAEISVKLELKSIIDELTKQKLISRGKNGIEVLGLSTAATLGHITTIFEESQPLEREDAVIDLAEKTSDLPCNLNLAKEYISDTYKLDTKQSQEVLDVAEGIGFIDFEKIDDTQKLLFNGNLFRRENANKINAICSYLSDLEASKIIELNDFLTKNSCIPLNQAQDILGQYLFKKLHSIGMYDVNILGNEQGNHQFVTKPSAFSKFTETIADDAFDLAKLFVTSLTYGITQSPNNRGRIRMIQVLMQKLINGDWVGPATAIGKDYKILELRRVVQVRESNIPGRFDMKLLKKDVGELALKVIIDGDVSTESLPLPSASIMSYKGPEETRTYQRKSQTPKLKYEVGAILNDLRTGQFG